MSITDVARLAGVTHGTVSRLINDRGGVAEDTARRIRDAMDQLGYEPPPLGRRRGRKPKPAGIRTGNVCLLLVGIGRGFLERPGTDLVVASMERELRRQDYNLLLSQAANFHDLPPAIVKRKVDGLLVVGDAHDSLPKPYRSLPAVWVLSSHAQPHRWADHVLPDNQKVASLALDYLAARGHRHVGFLNVVPKHPGFAERGRAFAAIAKERGLDARLFLARGGTEDAQRGWELGPASRHAAVIDEWQFASPRPTGLFVPSDEQTFRVYQLLRERGLRFGKRLEIISCDNQDAWLRHLTPRPPSIDLNFEMIGEHAVSQLLLRLQRPEQPAGTRILVAPRLAESS